MHLILDMVVDIGCVILHNLSRERNGSSAPCWCFCLSGTYILVCTLPRVTVGRIPVLDLRRRTAHICVVLSRGSVCLFFYGFSGTCISVRIATKKAASTARGRTKPTGNPSSRFDTIHTPIERLYCNIIIIVVVPF